MKLKIARKTGVSCTLSLLAMSLSFPAFANNLWQGGGVGSTTNNESAQIAEIKNSLRSTSDSVVDGNSAPASNRQFIPLPQNTVSNSTPQPQSNIATRKVPASDSTIYVASAEGGLQTIRKATRKTDDAPANEVKPAVVPNQLAAIQSTTIPPAQAAHTSVAPIIIPDNATPKTSVANVNALGNYRLNKKPYFYQCFYKSAAKYKVPVDLLIAIAQTESQMNTKAVGKNSSSEDLGVMQINTSWLPKLGREFGLNRHHLYEPCTNIDIGAWVLAHNFVQFGYTWNAVGAYNAKSPNKRVIYVRKVANNLEKLRRGEL